MAAEANRETALAVAKALLALEDPQSEPALIGLLSHDAAEVRKAAAQALGKFGTVAAVEPLLPLTEGVLASAELKEAARTAVRQIQGRLGPADAGRLSVAEATGSSGALSLASAGGEVSVVSGVASEAQPEGVAREARERVGRK